MTAGRSAAHPAPRHRRPRPARRRRSPATPGVGVLRAATARLAVVAVAVLVAPVVWAQVGDDLVATARDSEPGPTVSNALAYPGCRALRVDHPDGVAAVGAVNAGRKARPVTTRDTPLATANQALDSDGDGLVCERPRPTKAKGGRKEPDQQKAGRR